MSFSRCQWNSFFPVVTKIPKHLEMYDHFCSRIENKAAQRTIVRNCLNKRDNRVRRVDVTYFSKDRDVSTMRVKLIKSSQQFEG